ncbi:GntR family transcriptional regulator [Bifidobacterium vansinderenii]|uniref:Transcriptional regulator n=1 Tax=Bifidobacterium vansinderenii TaxID=1984871 RepID=A0A229VWU9_9BIFI|nr:GntR family transcriptional regulator [Bifidobacterium vansinderenii]OXN00104.1 transcriptional regulator [Bifidobacterium vansinderenii]
MGSGILDTSVINDDITDLFASSETGTHDADHGDDDFLITIDLNSATPAFEQIRSQLDGLIRVGLLEAGASMPPMRGLAKQFGVSLGTVQHAYEELESNGLIITSPGRPARVAEGKRLPCDVLAAIECLAVAAQQKNVNLGDTQNVLGAMWQMKR